MYLLSEGDTPRDVCLKLIWEVAHAVCDGKWNTREKGENKKEANEAINSGRTNNDLHKHRLSST